MKGFMVVGVSSQQGRKHFVDFAVALAYPISPFRFLAKASTAL